MTWRSLYHAASENDNRTAPVLLLSPILLCEHQEYHLKTHLAKSEEVIFQKVTLRSRIFDFTPEVRCQHFTSILSLPGFQSISHGHHSHRSNLQEMSR